MEEKLAAQPMPPHDHPSSLLSTQYQQLHNKHPLNNNNPTYTLPNYAPSNSNAFSWHPDANNGANISVIPEVNPFYHPRLHSHSHPMTTTTATSATPAPESSASAPPRRKSSNHGSSGRPTRVKGPCQACHETSDGCMRKAFHWPFAVSTTYNDKGKPFVYLCNKCGLRYNKSGGCVCRHCRWVLCKEEKRKAMEFIELMRRSRPDGRVDPEEDIENFVCAPKYWSCGHPWKVSWVLNTEHDEEDEDEDMPSRSHTNSTSSIHIPPIAAAIAPAFYVSSA
ncbi:hypothetical protein BDF20DRAFT_858841 [Mycotypha africana]|uniref:uncharacterized protein n=1 Tax=Mycotypha africana TaxID=64632 RepID=UPI00230007B9|nr:uncharacterized protein BDF20DRAFT_858841 [Mycotypha africana]KAI8984250.1 hypothetical protein BDF20DRAFT_858841 [Mycotypha africana]